MYKRPICLICCLIVGIFWWNLVWADIYINDAYGFTIDVPPKWTQISKQTIENHLRQAQTPDLKQSLLDMQAFALSGNVIMFQETVDGHFGPGNIVITVESGSPKLTDKFRKYVANAVYSGLKASGFKHVQLLASKRIQLNGSPAILTTCSYVIDYGDRKVQYRVMQYIVRGKKNHFIIAFTAPDNRFAQYHGFDKARDSFTWQR